MNNKPEYLNRMYIFIISAVASIAGITASHVLFPQEASIISVFLTAFTLVSVVNKLFDINRQEIWEKIKTPSRANEKLGISLLVIFLGVMFGYGCVTLSLKPDITVVLLDKQLGVYGGIRSGFTLADIDFGIFSDLIKHNLSVLLVVLLFATLYRTGGLLLIIVWNASTWGAVFSYIARNTIQSSGFMKGITTLLITYLCIFLHLVTESAAYILCAMTGFFVSKACIKYFNDTEKLARVIKTAFLILLFALLLIIISALVESNLTPRIVSYFVGK